MTFSFTNEFLQLLNKNVPEVMADEAIAELALRFNVPQRELTDLYVSCLWAEVDGTVAEDLVKEFKKEYLSDELY